MRADDEKEPAKQRRFMYSVIRMSAMEKKRVWNEDMDECVQEWVEVLSSKVDPGLYGGTWMAAVEGEAGAQAKWMAED